MQRAQNSATVGRCSRAPLRRCNDGHRDACRCVFFCAAGGCPHATRAQGVERRRTMICGPRSGWRWICDFRVLEAALQHTGREPQMSHDPRRLVPPQHARPARGRGAALTPPAAGSPRCRQNGPPSQERPRSQLPGREEASQSSAWWCASRRPCPAGRVPGEAVRKAGQGARAPWGVRPRLGSASRCGGARQGAIAQRPGCQENDGGWGCETVCAPGAPGLGLADQGVQGAPAPMAGRGRCRLRRRRWATGEGVAAPRSASVGHGSQENGLAARRAPGRGR